MVVWRCTEGQWPYITLTWANQGETELSISRLVTRECNQISFGTSKLLSFTRIASLHRHMRASGSAGKAKWIDSVFMRITLCNCWVVFSKTGLELQEHPSLKPITWHLPGQSWASLCASRKLQQIHLQLEANVAGLFLETLIFLTLIKVHWRILMSLDVRKINSSSRKSHFQRFYLQLMVEIISILIHANKPNFCLS